MEVLVYNLFIIFKLKKIENFLDLILHSSLLNVKSVLALNSLFINYWSIFLDV